MPDLIMETDEPAPLKEIVLLTQHDWNHIDIGSDTFFVGYRKPGEKSNFFDVRLNETTNEFQDESLKCKKLPNRVLSLEFNELNLRKFFVAPYAEYNQLHKSAISSLDISASGSLAVSADESTILVWKTDNGEVLRELEGHIMDINCCRFYPSGMVLLSGGMDMTVRIWSVETGECPRVLKGHKAQILDLEFIGKGEEVLSSARDGTVKKWNCGSGECVSTINLPKGIPKCIKLDKEKSLLFVGSDQGYLYAFDVNSNDVISTILIGNPCTSLTMNGNYAFVGTENGDIVVVDIQTKLGTIIQRLKIDRGSVQKLSTISDGLLASFNDGGICFYKDPINSAQSKIEFTGSDCDPIYDFSHTSTTLISACRDKVVRKYALNGLFN